MNMKIKLIVFAVVLAITSLLAAPAKSQTIEQKLTTILGAPDSTASKIGTVHDLLQGAANTRVALRAEGDKGRARLADITTQEANFATAIARHNAEAAANDEKVRASDDAVEAHNASQCSYPDGHPEQCAGYNDESRSLNANKEYLQSIADGLNREKTNLDAAGEGLQMQVDDFNKFKDDFNARNDANEHSIDVLMRVLAMLQKTTASCQDVLQDPTTTPERLHEACGQGADGNSTKPPLTHSGTGGASQNK
jgi:chromosome segregation ATPase